MSKQPAHDKAKGKAKAEPANRTIALNKRARHEYHLVDRFEAGLALQGWEVKSIRAGRANLTDGYAYIEDGQLYLIGADGQGLQRVTQSASIDTEAAWSPDGRKVLFTHIDKRSHGLGVCDIGSKSVQRIKFPGNTVIGPAYMPDGRVAVSLTDGRNPSIFLLGHGLQKER